MNKIIVAILIIVVMGVLILNFLSDPIKEKNTIIFHITLADPSLYSNGVFTDSFVIDKGEYSFRFVPNGSSPDILSITLSGEKFSFLQDFHLKGTPHQTGISEYFTWEYVGEKTVFVSEMEEVSITINPNGKIMGSVSVDILEN
ncbi:MAG: hypothetical protein OEY17_02375 [Nitrosopumilus sp.]|nr:hypothetical protein [Nitrosopumilus sp.]